MTVYSYSMEQHNNCCNAFAAANASARIRSIQDTAVLAVSILGLCLGRQSVGY